MVNQYAKKINFGYKIISFIVILLIVLLLGIAIGIISTINGTDMLGICIAIIIMFVTITILFRVKDNILRNIILAGIITRISLIIYNNYIAPLPDSYTDAISFENKGWNIAQELLNGNVNSLNYGSAFLYSKLIGYIYYFTGRIPIIIEFFNAILGILLIYIAYRIIVELNGTVKSAYIGSLIVALFPTLNLYSAIIMRENLITFSSTLSILYFIKWLNSTKMKYILLALILLLIASAFHGAMIVVGFVYIFFFCFYDVNLNCWKLSLGRITFSLIVSIIILFFFRSFLLNKIPANISLLFSTEYIGKQTYAAARDRCAYLVGLSPRTFLDILIFTPIRIIYFLFTPFPNMISSIGDIIGFIDAFLYFILIIYFIKGLNQLRHKNRSQFYAILLIIALSITTFAWGTSNYGTAIRHRQKMVTIITAISSLSMVHRVQKVTKSLNYSKYKIVE